MKRKIRNGTLQRKDITRLTDSVGVVVSSVYGGKYRGVNNMTYVNEYTEIKVKHQKEMNAFPLKAAFSNEQLIQGMHELGLEPTDTDKIVSLGYGCFIRKTDLQAYIDMKKRFVQEEKAARAKRSKKYLIGMFKDELYNHEYGYTRDDTDTLDALGIKDQDLANNSILKHGLEKAENEIVNWSNSHSEELY